MSALMCPTCADGTVEYQQHAGNSVCTSCGAVLEENAIVSEIMFGESSSGAAVVQGSYVGADQVRARAPQGYRSRGGGESREQTLANGRKEISSLAVGLGLSANMADAGQRYFMLAVNQGFTQGRRTKYVVAACLYSACRMNKTSHMLIDFSDILQVRMSASSSAASILTVSQDQRLRPRRDVPQARQTAQPQAANDRPERLHLTLRRPARVWRRDAKGSPRRDPSGRAHVS